MNDSLKDSLDSIRMSFTFFLPELLLTGGILLVILTGLIWKNKPLLQHGFSLTVLLVVLGLTTMQWNPEDPGRILFSGMIRSDSFTTYMKLLFSFSGILTIIMTWAGGKPQEKLSEYYVMILAIILGANLLVMSENLMMVFISLELVSITSYILTSFSFDKKATEGSLKYFVFGSVASAIMVYGFSLLYGITGTLTFTSIEFVQSLLGNQTQLFFVASTFSLAGFLYKIAAAPMHPWAPDVYQAAPMPVVAFFSVVPKLAGIGILSKFLLSINLYGQSSFDWQWIFAGITILTLTIGNFSALWQKNVKRLMAYSSIAQTGFMLIGILAFSEHGVRFLLFYAAVYVLGNYLVFLYLHYFENKGATTIADYNGAGKSFLWPSVFMLAGFVALTGLPPTAGFTGKLFIFSALWDAYATDGKGILLGLLIFGLLNTVISLFYYLRIPYYAFIRTGEAAIEGNNLTFLNLLGGILVLLILLLFFSPGLLMGWINKINFAF